MTKRLNQKVNITIDTFLEELIKNLLKLTSGIEDSYDNLVTFQKDFVRKRKVNLDSRITSSLKALGVHEPDCDHIAGAIVNQALTKERTVFVTLDFASILGKREKISSTFSIECCDPLYAIHHLI